MKYIFIFAPEITKKKSEKTNAATLFNILRTIMTDIEWGTKKKF